jgi:hypothetical protein
LLRLRTPPLAAPVDPARFAIPDRDMAALLKQLTLRARDADRIGRPSEEIHLERIRGFAVKDGDMGDRSRELPPSKFRA